MSTKKVPGSTRPRRYAEMRAGDLVVIGDIQRTPTDDRIKAFGSVWDHDRVGILLVAEITDKGPYFGQLHITNGGTRKRTAEMLFGPDYIFPTFIRKMTMAEAAQEFLSENRDAKLPLFYWQYRVGLVAREPVMLAIEDALDALGLEAGTSASYGNGVPGQVAALKACERIVSSHIKLGKSYDQASAKLAYVIGMCREAYADKSAHSADMMQAVNRLYRDNTTKLTTKTNRARLVQTVGRASVDAWNSQATSQRKLGGSESRSTYIAYFVGREYNKRLAPAKKLVLPSFVPAGHEVVGVGLIGDDDDE
jgi:hypothetical protein